MAVATRPHIDGPVHCDVIDATQGYCGHAHLSTTERYMHHAPASGDAAKLSAAYSAALRGGTEEVPNLAVSDVTGSN
jgi:hypothetical protein